MSLDDYILSHIDPEPEYLHALWRATHLHLNYPRMASGHLQGCVLRMLVHMIRPKKVLEIGTFTGYSALSMASALEPDGVLHTIEINDEQEDFTRPWIENSPWAEKIRFYIGDALELLANDKLQMMDGSFDLVFMDADKRHYVDYYRAVLPRVCPGGFIIADNTLWDGHVVEDAERCVADQPLNGKDAQTQGIIAFNDLVATDPAVERVILPLRDGLTLIRKL
ncbi:MAG: class I SAM-dependent methyltransferase [Bacteroidaceae bacterium]|nr:class I SAM-dependent methyltransferase [Bacteroidaceae bacterium]